MSSAARPSIRLPSWMAQPARDVLEGRKPPVEPRDAATVMLLRPLPGGAGPDAQALPEAADRPDAQPLPEAAGRPDAQPLPEAAGRPDAQALPEAGGLPDAHGPMDAPSPGGGHGLP